VYLYRYIHTQIQLPLRGKVCKIDRVAVAV